MENTHKNKYPHTSGRQQIPSRNTWCAVACRCSHMKPVFFVVAGLPVLTMPNVLHIFHRDAHPNANSCALELYSSKATLKHKVYFWGSELHWLKALPTLHPHVESLWREKSLIISYRSIMVLQLLYCLFYRPYQKYLWKWTEISSHKEFLSGMEFPQLFEYQI